MYRLYRRAMEIAVEICFCFPSAWACATEGRRSTAMELVMAEGNMIKGKCSRIRIKLEKLIKTLKIAEFSDFIPIFLM